MKKIFYFGAYDIAREKQTRNIVLSTTNKMSYIYSTIDATKYDVQIISTSRSIEGKQKGELVRCGKNCTLKLFTSKAHSNKILRVLDRWKLKTKYFFYLIKNLRKDSHLIVYHSLGYMGIVSLVRKLKKFKFILEIEEIYGDVIGNKKIINKELKYFKKVDGYIFPTKLLDDKVNTSKKPCVFIHGTYQVEPQRERIFNDDKIHVVYAGTFDPRKGGAIAAAAAGMFLSEKYHLHILGFGTEKDKNELLKIIDETSKQTNCTITFDGLKSGEEYTQFIQSCDIGLSTQNPNAAFNATSFPSKILSYMANGLRVVSIRIPAIEGSAIGEYMYYYDQQTPEQIAQAIMRVDMKDSYNSQEIISALDKRFAKDIKELLQNA